MKKIKVALLLLNILLFITIIVLSVLKLCNVISDESIVHILIALQLLSTVGILIIDSEIKQQEKIDKQNGNEKQ